MVAIDWVLTRNELDYHTLLINESLFALGNGYLGVRGNFEEGYPDYFGTIRGTYINAFYDQVGISYGEKLHAFPEKQQKIVNVIDSQSINIYMDGELFSLYTGEILHFERNLHLDQGFSERIIHWKSPSGKEVKLHFRRVVSFRTKELFAIDLKIEPISSVKEVKVVSSLNGDVSNYVGQNDPRVASGHAKLLHINDAHQVDEYSYLKGITTETNLEVLCLSFTRMHDGNGQFQREVQVNKIEETFLFKEKQPIQLTKYNIYTDTLRHGQNLRDKAILLFHLIKEHTFTDLLKQQKEYLVNYWSRSNIKIGGDDKLQLAIRFNLFQLLQSVGKEPLSNIAAKGLTGEGYDGHYFWDTEIFIIPVFQLTHPEIARNLLLYRYSILDIARQRAIEMGHEKGALFPWRTIRGAESSSYFPAGSAQYHISADIAYSFIQYYLVTQEEDFLKDYMAEMLFETARLWVDMGHMLNDQFRIDKVTGPDEYTCLVNNNYFTNVMAKYNLLWAVKTYKELKEKHPDVLKKLMTQISMTEGEVRDWQEAGEKMYLPYDEKRRISAQDDSFLQLKSWNLEKTPKEKFPLLLHYHPLTLYRFQVCKQADTVLAHFLLEDEQDDETIKNSYDYYEKITTHDSSLSYSIFSIMAAKLGYKEKAYCYFDETARLDLENRHGNTKDGLHLANMGGAWMSIVFGFAGVRIKESGLCFAPSLPNQWTLLEFHIQYQGRLIRIHMEENVVVYQVADGEDLIITHYGKPIFLEKGKEIVVDKGTGPSSWSGIN